MSELVIASWRALSRRAVLGGCAATAGLTLAAAPWLDRPGVAVPVLRGAAVLLACALAFAVDDPSGSLLAASPTPLRRRIAARVALATAVAGSAWGGLLLLAHVRGGGVPAGALSLEAAALGMLAVAAATALHTWRGALEPGVLTTPLVLGGVLAANLLPQDWALLAPDPAAPGWEAAHQRWAAVLGIAAAALLGTSRDVAAAGRGLPSWLLGRGGTGVVGLPLRRRQSPVR